VTAYAGLDAGTGGVRCLVIDEHGERLASRAAPWSYTTDDAGFPVLEADAVVRAVNEVLGPAIAEAGGVQAIGVASQRTGVVLLDRDDRELLVAPNADGRAIAEGVAMEREHGKEIYRVAGRLPAMLYLPARLAWWRANRAAGVAHALALSDWIVWRLGGAMATEPTQAAEMLVYDVDAGAWSESLCVRLGVPAGILPPVLERGASAGAAADGARLVPAGADTQAGLVGAGAARAGVATVTAGTTMLAGRCATNALPDPKGELWRSPTPVEGLTLVEAHCGEAGALAAWFATLFDLSPAGFASLAEKGQPGGGGVQVVDPWPSQARRFPLVRRAELSFAAPLLALGRPREDVARAVFEGIAFAAAEGLERVGMADEVVAVGGVTGSRAFADALAGGTGRPVRVVRGDVAARGAAIVAAAEDAGGVVAAMERMADRGAVVAPDPAQDYPSHRAAWRARAERTVAEDVTIEDV